jgi:hypothetical protein
MVTTPLDPLRQYTMAREELGKAESRLTRIAEQLNEIARALKTRPLQVVTPRPAKYRLDRFRGPHFSLSPEEMPQFDQIQEAIQDYYRKAEALERIESSLSPGDRNALGVSH